MDQQPETTELDYRVVTIEAWVWSALAAVVVAGSIVFWALLGMFWLANGSAQQPSIVIWMPPTANSDTTGRAQTHRFQLTPMPEHQPDVAAN